MRTVFVYNLLNVHEVQKEVWKEIKEGAPYVLEDFELKIDENHLLYLTKRMGSRVSGKLYKLTEEQLQSTDWYMGENEERSYIMQDTVSFQSYKRIEAK